MSHFVGFKEVGVDLHATHTEQKHELGLRVIGSDGGEYVYVQASAAIAVGEAVTVVAGYQADPVATGEAILGAAVSAIASGDFGFIQVAGVVSDAVVATATASGALIDRVAAGAGEFAAGAAGDPLMGVALEAEAGGVADVLLF